MFNRYQDWKAEVDRRGALVECDGANRVVAHINGYTVGEWDATYGSGWFNA